MSPWANLSSTKKNLSFRPKLTFRPKTRNPVAWTNPDRSINTIAKDWAAKLAKSDIKKASEAINKFETDWTTSFHGSKDKNYVLRHGNKWEARIGNRWLRIEILSSPVRAQSSLR